MSRLLEKYEEFIKELNATAASLPEESFSKDTFTQEECEHIANFSASFVVMDRMDTLYKEAIGNIENTVKYFNGKGDSE